MKNETSIATGFILSAVGALISILTGFFFGALTCLLTMAFFGFCAEWQLNELNKRTTEGNNGE